MHDCYDKDKDHDNLIIIYLLVEHRNVVALIFSMKLLLPQQRPLRVNYQVFPHWQAYEIYVRILLALYVYLSMYNYICIEL